MNLSRCFIDFTQCPKDKKLYEHFEELNPFKEFHVKDDNLVKIAIAMADKESPFTRIKDRETMLTSLFEFLEIDLTEKENKKLYDDVFNYKHKQILAIFTQYLILLHELDWTEYMCAKHTHDVFTQESVTPREEKEKMKEFSQRKMDIQINLKNTADIIKKLEAKIFPESRVAKAVLLEQNIKITLYSEKYAENNTYI